MLKYLEGPVGHQRDARKRHRCIFVDRIVNYTGRCFRGPEWGYRLGIGIFINHTSRDLLAFRVRQSSIRTYLLGLRLFVTKNEDKKSFYIPLGGTCLENDSNIVPEVLIITVKPSVAVIVKVHSRRHEG